jgi:Fanconi anemia group M protein
MLDSEDNHDLNLNESGLEYREYQKKIAQQCILKNSLVVLPTGLGKTIIALYVAIHILQKYPKESKIIVLAPTRPLINQHFEVFQKSLSIPEEQFEVLTGKIPPAKRTVLFQENKILFYTPQTLRNDLVNKKYSLEEVCLIVFDEAHHASGEFPYTLIADTYMEQNPDGTILALTASPGASKDKIKELCNALHIPTENIHTRTRKDEDVKVYLKPMDIYKIGVDMTLLMKESYDIISKLLEERLQYLSEFNFLEKQADVLLDKIIRKDLLKLNSELLSLLKQEGDKTGIYTALSINAQALILFHMMELVEQQGLDVLLIYLENLNSKARKNSSSKAVKILAADHRLQRLYLELRKHLELTPKNLTHPKYELLKSILIKEIEKNSKARILVFVKLRDSVKNIVHKLKEHSTICVARFVGQATKSSDDKGLSQKKQLEILNKFKNGQLNTLISTNVGEEGIDIAECDLVIFYDVVVSETRFIQRRGRTARHRKGKVIILYCKGTKDEIYLRIALMKLKKMNINLRSNNFKDKNTKLPIVPSTGEPRQNINMEKNLLNTNQKNYSPSKSNQATLQKFLNTPFREEVRHQPIHDIFLSKHLPVKFGLRSKLKEDNIPFNISQNKNHIVLFKNILIHIYQPSAFSDESLSSIIQRISLLMRKYELVLNIVDFVGYQESYRGEENLIKLKLKELGNSHKVKLIPIDNIEELYFIVKNIYVSNKNKELE